MTPFFSQIMKGNKGLWAIYIILLALSCVVTFSAMSRLALMSSMVGAPMLRHIIFLFAGFAIIVLIQIVNFKLISFSSIPILLFSIGILIFVQVTGGVNSDSTSRFSSIGQPSEYVKLGLILVMSDVIMRMRQCKEFPVRTFRIVIAILAVIIFLIFTENLSSAVLIGSIMFVMLLAGGMGLKRMLTVLFIAVALAGAVISIAYIIPEKQFTEISKEHKALNKLKRVYTWKSRIEKHLAEDKGTENGKITVDDSNRQEVYAKVAVCRGGWTPNGLGSSLQRNYLPEAYSDYVFAIAVEEWGFVLGIIIMLLYLSIFAISLYYIKREERVYRKMLLLGCSFAITIQAAVHIAVSVGAMPVTGQTLPLISRGGASILVVSAMIGIIIKITATPSAQNATEFALADNSVQTEHAPSLTDNSAQPLVETERAPSSPTNTEESLAADGARSVSTGGGTSSSSDDLIIEDDKEEEEESVFIIED